MKTTRHDLSDLVSKLTEDYLSLTSHYTGGVKAHFHTDAATGPTDTTNVNKSVVSEQIEEFLDFMTFPVSSEKVANWVTEERFVVALTSEKMDVARVVSFLTPLYTEDGVEFGMAAIPLVDTDDAGYLYDNNAQLKLLTYKRVDGKPVELVMDLSALIESDTTPRVFSRAQAEVNGTVFSRLSRELDKRHAPQFDPAKGSFLTNRVTGTEAGDHAQIKEEMNELFAGYLDQLARRIDMLNNPNMIDPDEQAYWIRPVLDNGRRMFQIVDVEGSEQLETPSSHRGEVFALCVAMNREADDE